MFYLAYFYSLVYYFWSKIEDYPSGKPAQILNRVVARLGRKVLPRTNTLAYNCSLKKLWRKKFYKIGSSTTELLSQKK